MADSDTAIYVALIGVGGSVLTVWLNHHFDIRRKQLTGEIPVHPATPPTFPEPPRHVAQSADRNAQTKSFLKAAGILFSIMTIGIIIAAMGGTMAGFDSSYVDAGIIVAFAALFGLFVVRVPAHLKKTKMK